MTGTEAFEDDLVMENCTQVAKCPITLKKIIEPWKNPKCDHVYEKSAIMDYMKGKSNKR